MKRGHHLTFLLDIHSNLYQLEWCHLYFIADSASQNIYEHNFVCWSYTDCSCLFSKTPTQKNVFKKTWLWWKWIPLSGCTCNTEHTPSGLFQLNHNQAFFHHYAWESLMYWGKHTPWFCLLPQSRGSKL